MNLIKMLKMQPRLMSWSLLLSEKKPNYPGKGLFFWVKLLQSDYALRNR